jgi:hypothetical protein
LIIFYFNKYKITISKAKPVQAGDSCDAISSLQNVRSARTEVLRAGDDGSPRHLPSLTRTSAKVQMSFSRFS